MNSLTQDELARLLKVSESAPLHRLAILVAFNHGLRASEVTTMTGGQVKDGYLRVKRLKGSLETIQRLLPNEKELELISASVGNEGRIFNFSSRWFQKLMNRYGKMAGIPAHKSHPHSLKHSCAMLGLEGGMKINEVQAYLGHKSLASTGQYLKVNDETASLAFAAAVGV
jgi:integrase